VWARPIGTAPPLKLHLSPPTDTNRVSVRSKDSKIRFWGSMISSNTGPIRPEAWSNNLTEIVVINNPSELYILRSWSLYPPTLSISPSWICIRFRILNNPWIKIQEFTYSNQDRVSGSAFYRWKSGHESRRTREQREIVRNITKA
jgi:hypothetical protein